MIKILLLSQRGLLSRYKMPTINSSPLVVTKQKRNKHKVLIFGDASTLRYEGLGESVWSAVHLHFVTMLLSQRGLLSRYKMPTVNSSPLAVTKQKKKQAKSFNLRGRFYASLRRTKSIIKARQRRPNVGRAVGRREHNKKS